MKRAFVETQGRLVAECLTLSEYLDVPERLAQFKTSEEGGVAFTGSGSYAEAETILREGWPAGAARARALSASLTAETAEADRTERPAPVWDVAGDDVDVDRFLTGEPEAMVAWETETVPASGRIVRVVLEGAVNCDVKESHLAVAGVLTAAAVDVLEARGVRAEVWVAYPTRIPSGTVEVRHRLKAAEEPLDLPRVVAGMHPSAFRRVAFRWYEGRADLPGGYGRDVEALRAEGDLVFPAGKIGTMPEAERLPWLRKQAEAVFGIGA